MRRFVGLIVIPVLACVVLAGCGGSKAAPTATPTATPTVNTNAKVTATGAFGTVPTVTIPQLNPSSNLAVKTLVQGTGPVLVKADRSLAVNFVLYLWDGKASSLKENTFTSHPTILNGNSGLLPGLQMALGGQKIGSRVLAVIPPKDGFGASGSASIGVTGTTTLVFVIDIIQAYSNAASATGTVESNGGNGLPTVSYVPGQGPVPTIPASSPPSSLQVKTLIKGAGPVLAKGEYVVAQYNGYIWRTKQVFGSSWTSNLPIGFIFQASPPQVISGWDTGLAGQTVGSRVMLVIPPKDGYGSAGASRAGIKGTDTVVFVIDILDAFKTTAGQVLP